ncbi:protein of unknown function DUF29 [Candidatus Magnetoovum chiemensis]|nr:protein of unknown function DUF29 [Candidatus Magnetoovum chiemensis]
MTDITQKPKEQADAVKEQSLYETDFYLWSLKTAELLRQGKFDEIDIENTAEEIESLGKRDKREVLSRLSVLIAYLLKWQYEPQKRYRSRRGEIFTERFNIELVIDDSPSLKQMTETLIKEAFNEAVIQFEIETGLNKNTLFPEKTCPYTFEQLSDYDFLPE